MTDNDIIKALENCSTKGFCKYINYCENAVLYNNLLEHAVALLKRQKAEIERLNKEVNLVSIQFQDLQERNEDEKNEAVKEFAEAVKLKFYEEFDEIIPSVMANEIDVLAKEVVGDD